VDLRFYLTPSIPRNRVQSEFKPSVVAILTEAMRILLVDAIALDLLLFRLLFSLLFLSCAEKIQLLLFLPSETEELDAIFGFHDGFRGLDKLVRCRTQQARVAAIPLRCSSVTVAIWQRSRDRR